MRKIMSKFSAMAIVLGLGAAVAEAQVGPVEARHQTTVQSQPVLDGNYRLYNGQWWYRMQTGQWKYWKNGQWVDYKSGTFRLTAQAGGANADAKASDKGDAKAGDKKDSKEGEKKDTRGFTADNPQYAGFIKPSGGPSTYGAGAGYTKAGGPIFDGFNGPGGGYVDGTTYYVPNPNAYPAYVQPGSGVVGSDIGGVVGPPK